MTIRFLQNGYKLWMNGKTHLCVQADTSDDVEMGEDEDTQHYDPYEDDPSHPDSCWK